VACKQFYSVKYIRLPELLAELAIARGDSSFKKVISQYQKYNLLIMNEWLLVKQN
jgi:DNA replication protein DnaC